MRIAQLGRPRVSFSSATNVVWHGNSLVAGVGSTGGQTLPVQVAALAPMAGSGASTVNGGVNGQDWGGMQSTAASVVDAAWVSGKINVLLLWETTNSVFGYLKTASQTQTLIADYVAARKAVHPWTVLHLTTIPRAGGGNVTDQTARDNLNAVMASVDTYVKANYRGMGIDAVCDVRQAGSPFAFANYLPATFDAIGSLWSEGTGAQIHLSNAGYAVVAGYVAEAMRRLPRPRG